MNVVPLGNHLRAHQQIDLARVQPRQQPLQVVPPAHRVAIHAADARARKNLRQPLLALLRPRAEIVKVFAVALRAARRHGAPEAAVVALQPLAFARLPASSPAGLWCVSEWRSSGTPAFRRMPGRSPQTSSRAG